jgi:hypothetical protein
MGDQYRINNTSQLLKNQMDEALKIDGSTIQQKSDALKTIFEKLRGFFYNMAKPTMKVRKAPDYGPPRSEDYNQTMDELNVDINVSYDEIKNVENAVVASYNGSQIGRKLLQNRVQHVQDKLKDFVLLSNIGSQNVVIGRDSFNDLTKIDSSKVHGTLAYIDTASGTVSLANNGIINRTDTSTVPEVVPGVLLPDVTINGVVYKHYGLMGTDSNGFCGNFHEITVNQSANFKPVTDQDDEFQFVGEENTHADRAAIVDGNTDTWFEYEIVNLSDDYKEECKQYGYAFDSESGPIRWDREPDINNNTHPPERQLRLRLKFVLDEPEMINKIVVSPYTPPNEGATKPFDIEDIFISSDGTSPLVSIFGGDVENNQGLDNLTEADVQISDRTFNFPRRMAKVVVIQFTQNTKYDISIGHIYYKNIVTIKTTKKALFGLIHSSKTKTTITRINGPNIDITQTGASKESSPIGDAIEKFSYAATKIAMPILGNVVGKVLGGVLDGIGSILGSLFGTTKKEVIRNDVESGIERFPGWRYCIGIRDVGIYSISYAETSEIVSKPFQTASPVYKISLRVNDEVPKAFIGNSTDPVATAEKNATEWIKYYVTIDDGSTWYRIAPQGYPEIRDEDNKLVPEVYTINSKELKETRGANVGFIESPTDVTSVRLKAVLSRPKGIEDAASYSPIIYDYALSMYTEVNGL